MDTNTEENKIGERIKQAREEMRPYMSQLKLGREMGFKNGTMISRWESGERRPGSRNLQKLCRILNKQMGFFFPKENEPPPYEDIKLPALISVFKRQLIEAEHRYTILCSTMSVVEVPIVSIDKLSRGFEIEGQTKYTQILKSELNLLDENDLSDRLIIEITTDTGDDYGIHKGASVVLNYKPQKIDGGLYLITYQKIMAFRNLKWEKNHVIMIDSKGISITAKESEVYISGQVIKFYYIHTPLQIKV